MVFNKRVWLFIISMAWVMATFSFSGAFGQEWARVSEKDGIVVYERQRPNAVMRDFRAEMVLDSSPGSVLALLDDTEQASRWFAHCRRLVRIAEISPDEHMLYSITEFPWPMKDRDAVLHSNRRFEAENQRFVIDYRSDDGFPCLLAEPDLARVVSIEGQWSVTPLEGGRRALVTSRLQVDVGTPLPGWALNSFFREATHQTFVNMRQAVQEPKYLNATPSREYMRRFGVPVDQATGPVPSPPRSALQ